MFLFQIALEAILLPIPIVHQDYYGLKISSYPKIWKTDKELGCNDLIQWFVSLRNAVYSFGLSCRTNYVDIKLMLHTLKV